MVVGKEVSRSLKYGNKDAEKNWNRFRTSAYENRGKRREGEALGREGGSEGWFKAGKEVSQHIR